MADSVKLERRDAVALVILNRPEVLNAINVAMRETLITLLSELNKDEAVRAIVLTGSGERAFCSGQDLDETSKYGVGDVDAWLTRQHAMYAAVRDLDKPSVVAFNGTAAGAGFQIGLCADLRVGFPDMKLGQPEIKAGLASIVGSYLMTMHLGLSKNIE
jgi:enoyl-CoA hydratase/carnithine racemase